MGKKEQLEEINKQMENTRGSYALYIMLILFGLCACVIFPIVGVIMLIVGIVGWCSSSSKVKDLQYKRIGLL